MKHRKPTNMIMAPVKTTVLLLTLFPKYMRMTPNKTRNIPNQNETSSKMKGKTSPMQHNHLRTTTIKSLKTSEP
jgi:hypothetical protein